jgi:hypothetical protein
MAEPVSSNTPRQLLQLGATLLVAAAVAWTLGANWKVVATVVAIAGAFGLAGLVVRRDKQRS